MGNVLLIVLALVCFTGCAQHKISERQWITRLQTKTGAIALSNDREFINPYFANLAVWALLKTHPSQDEVKFSERWIDWYLGHLNGAGPELAVRGSIYDYQIKNKKEFSTLNYDSLDAYAATFLMVLNQYYQVTHDKNFIDLRMIQILIVFDAIQTSVRDQLTVAKPQEPVSYLMDNVEVWRGLVDFAALMNAIGQNEKAREIGALAFSIQRAIESKLWVPSLNVYLPYVGATADLNSFYPDATAMLWPILFHLPEAESRKKQLWQDFKSRFKKKWQSVKVDLFSWSFVAYLALQMDDPETAQIWEKSHKKNNRDWPWHIGEAAGYLLYLDLK